MSSYSVKRPITVLMGILIIIVLGLFSVTRLPLTLFPEINLPFVITVTDYVGASPETVEAEVSNKIESTVATIGNFSEISSMSNESFAVSIITFAEGSNMDSIVIEMRELINNIAFAEGVGSTRILRISPDMLPVMTITLFRDYDDTLTDEEKLILNTEWINRDILLDLQGIPGVADVSVSGAADVVLEINLDQDTLDTYAITHNDVLTIIEEQNVGGLVGVALDNGELRMLYIGDAPNNLDEIASLPILNDGGNIIYLSDLILEDGIKYINANTDTYSKINGIQGIQVSFTKQADYGITEVTSNIVSKLDQIMDREGDTAHYTVLLNQGEYINQSIGSVLNNIIVGGILAILILFLFLRDVKPTVVVGLAIPISVIAAFMLMYFTNVTLNIISMGGLALGIGMLVDNSIVVIENIYRMIQTGKSKKEASIEGAKQVAGAITASTLTTIAVFIPILFVEGLVAEVFISMALTIAYSLSASLFIALTLVPSLSAKILNDQKETKESKFMHQTKAFYKKSVLFTLRHKLLTLMIVLLLLVGSSWLVISKGFILLPTSDEGTIDINIITTQQTSFESKALYTDLITETLLELDDVETVSASIGSGGFGGFGMGRPGGNASANISMTINLKENRNKSTAENRDLIEQTISNLSLTTIPNFEENQIVELNVSSQNSTGNFGGASGINIKVSGYDLETLESIANDITQILSETEGVVKADNGISQGADNVKITINRENAMLYGLTSQAVLDNLNYLYTNLSGLGQTNQLTVNIEGIDYTLDLPNNQFSGGISFEVFGDYLNFLSGVLLFDQPTRDMIDAYLSQSGTSIYTLDPSGLALGEPIKFIINPFLRISGGTIVLDFNPMSADPTLASLAIAPLYEIDSETSVTAIDYMTGFQTIRTDGSNRYLEVTAQVEQGYNVTLVSGVVTDRVNAYLESTDFLNYGNGYNVTFQGENEEILEAVSELALASIVAILLVYMVMAIQFQSLLYPFIILGTIPLAFTGGMLALLITNSNLSLVAIMGFIILIGVVVNNGIVLIDYINKLREQGKMIKEAIVEAGETRLRPIFMTALTTVLALLTLAIGFGEGSELLQPMAITAIGGLIYATLLTLVVVPTIYALFNRKKIKEEEMSHANNEG
ncbi:MAG: AcrB/AcrD/AcrF family protein [Tenericutes bacterium HGW-Tenericutes-6]|nr:MAG: AcrB/AcrD/AcrF family protein [Tenericutes bacterium HGW-Tenericutes-6]